MKKNNGYTLVELLIAVTVSTILITTGISAYSVARNRQQIREMGELVEVTLREAQKSAQIGNNKVGTASCNGGFIGHTVSISAATDRVTITPTCSGLSTGAKNVSSTNLDFLTNHNFIYYQNGGMNITSSENIDFRSTTSGITHRITISPPGSILYVGAP